MDTRAGQRFRGKRIDESGLCSARAPKRLTSCVRTSSGSRSDTWASGIGSLDQKRYRGCPHSLEQSVDFKGTMAVCSLSSRQKMEHMAYGLVDFKTHR